MNTQIDVSRKIMEILDDNAQQVPEGFYLEVCNQLKKLHLALPTSENLERRELAVTRGRIRLERHAAELNALKEELNKSVRDYNNCVKRFREKKRKLDQVIDRNQVREDCLKEREKLLNDWSDNLPLSELQKLLAN